MTDSHIFIREKPLCQEISQTGFPLPGEAQDDSKERAMVSCVITTAALFADKLHRRESEPAPDWEEVLAGKRRGGGARLNAPEERAVRAWASLVWKEVGIYRMGLRAL